jgi:putative protease
MIEALNMPTMEGKLRTHLLDIPNRKRGRRKGELSICVSSLKALESVLPYADRICFELNNHFDEALVMCKKRGTECVLMLPPLSFELPDLDAESIMINSVDQFEKYADRKLYGHYSMNFFNSLTMPKLFQYTLSVELSKEDIREIADHYTGRLETLVFGRIELMVTREPSLNEGMLVDKKRKRFPFYRDQFGYVHILNSSDLFLLDFLDELEEVGIDSFGIDLRRRDRELCETVAKAFYERDLTKKQVIKKKCGSITSGHYLRGVD